MSQNFQGGGFRGLLITKFEKFGPELIQYQYLICYSLLSRDLNFEFLSVPNASLLSVLPTKPAGKVWAKSKKKFWGVVQIP